MNPAQLRRMYCDAANIEFRDLPKHVLMARGLVLIVIVALVWLSLKFGVAGWGYIVFGLIVGLILRPQAIINMGTAGFGFLTLAVVGEGEIA